MNLTDTYYIYNTRKRASLLMLASIAPGMCCKLCFRATLIILQLPWYSIKSTRLDKHVASARRPIPLADN